MILLHEIELAIKSSPCKGWQIHGEKFHCSVVRNKKWVWIGSFDTQREANEAVFQFRLKHFISNVSKFESDVFAGRVWENTYIAYPSGRVFNLRGELIKGVVTSHGYLQYSTSKFCVRAHQIIATLFIPNPMHYDQINHIDGNKLNNSVANLEWCTPKENIQHALKTGLAARLHGEQHPGSKLTDSDVAYIKSHCKKGDREYGTGALGRKFGVSQALISRIVRGINWKHITESVPEKPSEAE